MRKFIHELFTNRLGIVLAALNVCFFLSMNFFQKVFSHIHGESCFVFKKFFLFPMILNNAEHLMTSLNLPAVLSSYFAHSLLRQRLGEICAFSEIKIQFVLFSAFVVLQWLFIAWLAKALAAQVVKNRYSER